MLNAEGLKKVKGSPKIVGWKGNEGGGGGKRGQAAGSQ